MNTTKTVSTPGGQVDFTLMYAAHDAFRRDLDASPKPTSAYCAPSTAATAGRGDRPGDRLGESTGGIPLARGSGRGARGKS